VNESIDVRALVTSSWESVFCVEGLGDDADFFELGGDSLAALETAALVHEGLGHPEWIEEDWLAHSALERPNLGEQVTFMKDLLAGGPEFVEELLRNNTGTNEVSSPAS
jgi:hypothetical protein